MDWIGLDWMDGLSSTAVTPRASLQSDANKEYNNMPHISCARQRNTFTQRAWYFQWSPWHFELFSDSVLTASNKYDLL